MIHRNWRPVGAFLLAFATLPSAAVADENTDVPLVEVGGDIRLRYETVDIENSPSLERGRFRARLDLAVHAADDIDVVFQLATGDGSPVSTNLTFGDGFAARDLRIGRAYVDWRVNDAWHLRGGKMKAPWFRAGDNGLVWDSDLNPEGVAALYKDGKLFGSLALLAPESRPSGDSSLLVSAQGGMQIGLGGVHSVTAGLGYYAYTNTDGFEPFYNGSAAGNTVDADGLYVNDYALLEVFAEYRAEAAGLPLSVFAKWVNNTEANGEDTAYALGAGIGADSEQGDWQLSWEWMDTDADAVVGTFNESDFADGRTNSRGHSLHAQYLARENVSLGLTLIRSEFTDPDDIDTDFDRVMLDIEFSF